MSRALVMVLLIGTTGCGVDLGGGGAVEVRSGHGVGFGRVAASTKIGTPLNDHGVLVGTSIEGRAEQDVGSRFMTGVMLGWGSGPAAIDGRWGCEAYAEFGTPIRGTLFHDGDLYAGAAIAVPFLVGPPRRIEELNEGTWILRGRVEIVPSLRGRFYAIHPDDAPIDYRADVGGGVSMRMRFFTDLF